LKIGDIGVESLLVFFQLLYIVSAHIALYALNILVDPSLILYDIILAFAIA